ncbi:MAG TPA: type I-E CRISPR-associated protein Cas7/Cse4/CasC, partial [Polyangiaceae bacterium]
KRNGTAPHTPADFLEVVVRRDAPVSLANAFLKPVRPRAEADVMDVSIAALRTQAMKYDAAYGDAGVVARYRLCLRESEDAKPTHTSLAALAKDIEDHLAKDPE